MYLLTAKASTTEESREGKLHAGICGGCRATDISTVTVFLKTISLSTR
jgi:hypothetical protein